MADWRDKVDLALKEFLEAQIKESNLYKDAYSTARNQANAQLWIAVAVLSKQVFNLNQKLKVVEDAIKDVGSNVQESIRKIEEVQNKVAEVKEVSEKKVVPKKSAAKKANKKDVAKKAVKKATKKVARKPIKRVTKKKALAKRRSGRSKGISKALKKF